MSLNLLNRPFYEEMEVEQLQNFAEITGFSSGIDIQTIFEQIKDAQQIVELGSGYGRSLYRLRALGFSNKLLGIERTQRFADYANAHLGHGTPTDCADLMTNLNLPDTDVFLWLWSGIMEFSYDEKIERITHFSKSLKKNGRFFIDLPAKKVQKVGDYESDQRLILRQQWGVLRAEQPTAAEMHQIAHKAKLNVLPPIFYFTDKGYERQMFIFQKP
ncbi:class I SAM-dependent methyltransferase [Persicobacter psychrovividus]|uniref:Methyltransferase domain-containing protein n=1 Tax=Persicobacter psychrovividus TaxID=387638 RepID=A0ABN6LBV6_9BACT|nr:hypothetical protein PEPS_11720 [Persicobacter psychrovividus]